ncbi:aggregation factor core [Roseobacter weihaiensis]|uniref:aggregation factor core n=1 Tax=Roseobacter weihaiensis TaxID=2763262 RepID=UPI001D0B2063|nr:aggregation factor core [Roseobacter sp. H9]
MRFDEAAPKDRFTVENAGSCPLGEFTLRIDLGASAAGLIFDVTGQGAGVQVFQPLELVEGQAFLSEVPQVRDGDNVIVLPVMSLSPGGRIVFTVDVDDTAGSRATIVSGAEIQDAKIVLEQNATLLEATFGQDAVAGVAFSGCHT